MSTTSHTPGPWIKMSNGFIRTSEGNHIAKTDVSFFLSEEEMEANGDLIAAAPDLLEALEELLESSLTGSFDIMYQARANARAVIDKATGK